MTRERVLLIEDDHELGTQIAEQLGRAGFVVTWWKEGRTIEAGDVPELALVILDLMLPGTYGMDILKDLRARSEVPVLVLSARSDTADKVRALKLGADDYMTKPFEMDEVVYRLRALIRRTAGHASTELTCGPLRLDTLAGRFTMNGVALQLTAQEFRILDYLMHHAGAVVSRTELMEHVYDRHFDSDSNVLEVLVGRIRRKLGGSLIHTVRGLGYRLAAEDAA